MNFISFLFTIRIFSFVIHRFFMNKSLWSLQRFFSSWFFNWKQGQINFLVFLSIFFIRRRIRLRFILNCNRFFLKYILSSTDIFSFFFTFVHIVFKLTIVSTSWTRFSSTETQMRCLLEIVYLYIPGRILLTFLLPISSYCIAEIIRKNIIYKHKCLLIHSKKWLLLHFCMEC